MWWVGGRRSGLAQGRAGLLSASASNPVFQHDVVDMCTLAVTTGDHLMACIQCAHFLVQIQHVELELWWCAHGVLLMLG